MLPHYVGKDTNIKNALINEGCIVEGNIDHSVLSSNVRIEKGALVHNSVILSDCIIESGAIIHNAVVDEGITVKANTIIGKADDTCIYLVSEDGIEVEE